MKGKFLSISTNIIVLNENYKDFYGEEYSPDLLMFGYENNSMIETTTDPSSFGGSTINRINEDAEVLILFYWDGLLNYPYPLPSMNYQYDI